jgi:uncharacterized SAM-binding protein YcdF (DUF218 family)
MYFTLKAVVRTLLLPPASPLIIAIIGALLLWRRRRFGGPLLFVGLAAMWLLATPIVADAVSRLAEHYPALDLSKPTDAQAIVILGGGGVRNFAPEYFGPEADFGLLERLSYGAFVARQTGLPILVSGAPDEAIAMKTSLSRDFGAPTRWVDRQSRDTYENSRFSARLLNADGIKRIILVTSSTHMWRSTHEFESVGLEVFRLVPSPAALMRSHLALYELLGEPMRRLQAALGLRERFDLKAAGATAK